MGIDGEWSGFYVQPQWCDEECPIAVQFKLRGNRLSGTMVDERLSWTRSIREILESLDIDSETRRNYEEWVQVCPDAHLTTTLARDSRLSGKVSNQKIEFIKEYAYPQEWVWSGPGIKTLRQVQSDVRIVFSGTLSGSGKEIEGEWRIYKIMFFGLLKQLEASGKFFLSRKHGSPQPN